jgi:hypothetical protein
MQTAGGYTKHLKRSRSAVRGEAFNLATDFVPQQRYWWEGNGFRVPDAKLFMQPYQPTGNAKPAGFRRNLHP